MLIQGVSFTRMVSMPGEERKESSEGMGDGEG